MTSWVFRIVFVIALSIGAVGCTTNGTSGQGDTRGPAVTAGSTEASTGLSGSYAVTGTNADGSAYRGKVVISGDGPQYQLDWVIGTGTSTGTGTLRGTTLAVRFEGAVTGTGTVTYQLQSDGRLVGTWRVDGNSGQGTETLTPE